MRHLIVVLAAGFAIIGGLNVATPPAFANAALCETPAPVAGTILGELADGGRDTWAYDLGEGDVVAQAESVGGTIRLDFAATCGGEAVCFHEGPNVPPGGLGTFFPNPGCELAQGFVTVTQTSPSASGSTHYWLRLCLQSEAIGGRICPTT